ncbi:unnamed protein product [Durusdinium trenchii]|uniref:Major facilitator superfamily (MFS) profile domain-containing protein n=1 Tax=Durusdinium trenchii TaxID=1381693 RepID=A0ABP0MC74_9DINO
MAAMANTQDQSRTEHFMRALRVTVAAISGAGTATLQARQLLITKTAEPYGEDAVVEATTGLATAYSLGSVIEFILSPLFGRLSDRFGRKPLVLFLMIGPACMRTLCAVVNRPRARIRLLWLDFASARAIGIQPFMGMCGTMIGDVFPADAQPAARAQLSAAQALGSIIGNYLSGWWNARAGPQSTYLFTAAVPLLSLAFASVCLRETNANKKDYSAASNPKTLGSKSVFALLLDPECCLLAAALGLYEFMNYPPMNSVSILFMKERLKWGPLEAGRFASGWLPACCHWHLEQVATLCCSLASWRGPYSWVGHGVRPLASCRPSVLWDAWLRHNSSTAFGFVQPPKRAKFARSHWVLRCSQFRLSRCFRRSCTDALWLFDDAGMTQLN